jgi:hypothetical protein
MINYTISISYRNWDKKKEKKIWFQRSSILSKEWKNVELNFFSKYRCYDLLIPHTTSERENVKTTI